MTLKKVMPEKRVAGNPVFLNTDAMNQRALAKTLGLSQTTVSRALRNDHRVAKKTRERVAEAAKRLDYRLDIFSAALSSKAHSRAVEFEGCPIVALHQPYQGRSTFQRLVLDNALGELATSRGFALRHHLIAPEETAAQLGRQWYHQGVQGILLVKARGDLAWFDDFPWDRFCIVNLTGRLAHLPFPTVRPDHFDFLLDFLREAWARGFRRIGATLFRHHPPHPDDTNLRAAFYEGQRQLTGGPNPELLFEIPQRGLVEDQDMRARFQNWIRDARPDALFVFSGRELYWLKDMPDEHGVRAFFLQIPSPLHTGEQVAGYLEPWGDAAKIAIQWLENAIRLRQYGPVDPVPRAVIRGRFQYGEGFPARRDRSR